MNNEFEKYKHMAHHCISRFDFKSERLELLCGKWLPKPASSIAHSFVMIIASRTTPRGSLEYENMDDAGS
jgi:hypothetical protein